MSQNQNDSSADADNTRRNMVAALFGTLGVAAFSACTSEVGATEGAVAGHAATGVQPGLRWVSAVGSVPTGSANDSEKNLRDLVGATAGEIVIAEGFGEPGDGGGGLFYWDDAGGANDAGNPDNGGTVIVPLYPPSSGSWKRIYSGALNVKWFGAGMATEAGSSPDTLGIRRALAAAVGEKLVFPKPRVAYFVNEPISLPSHIQLEGVEPGLIEIQVPAESSFSVFDVDNKQSVSIRGFKFTKSAGIAPSGEARAIAIRGASSDVVVEMCTAEAFQRGFNVSGSEGTVPGQVKRVTFRNCKALNSPTQFGFNVDDADVVTFDDCHASGNGLDGFKLRKATLNVTVLGCSANNNGLSGAGDGMDVYAGGDTFAIFGFVAEGNKSHGLTVKTGVKNFPPNVSAYGVVRNVQLTGLRLRNNLHQGLYLTVSTDPIDPIDPNEPQTASNPPLVCNVSILGGIFEGNAYSGLYLNGRNISVVGPLVRDNGQHGVVTSTRAMDVEIVAPVCIANGRSLAGHYDGINASGTRIRVKGGTFVGADDSTVTGDSDYAALTKYQRHAVRVTGYAVDCDIDIGHARPCVASHLGRLRGV